MNSVVLILMKALVPELSMSVGRRAVADAFDVFVYLEENRRHFAGVERMIPRQTLSDSSPLPDVGSGSPLIVKSTPK